MTFSFSRSFIFIVCVACALAVTAADTDVPLHLKNDDGSFADTIKNNPVVVVMFYASWCAISKRMMQPYQELHAELLPQGVVLAKVNTIEEPELYWQYDIKGFPTFGLFKDGESLFYEGEPEIDALRTFIEQNAPNAVQHLDPQTFYDLDMKTRPLAVEFFDEVSKADASSTFDFACKKFKFPHCYASTSKEFADMLGVAIPSRVMIKEYASAHLPVVETIDSSTDEFASADALLGWMKSVAFPALVEHSEANAELIFSRSRPGFQTHVIVFVKDKLMPDSRVVLDAALAAGERFLGKMVVTFVDHSNKAAAERVADLMEDTEVSEDGFPTAVVVHSATKNVKFFKLPSGTAITEESLAAWLSQFLAGELKHDKIIGEENAE